MGKLEDLQRRAGANSLESMGQGVDVGAADIGPAAIPARLRGIAKSRDAAVIPVDRIIPDPNQPRVEFDAEALGRLAESLKARGQLQPIRVRWEEAMDRYIVVVGERRWRAAQIAGMGELTCVIVAGSPTPEEVLEDQLVENCLREDLRPVEQARAYQSLMTRLRLTQRSLAERLSVSQAQIAQALRLLELPDPIRGSVEAGAIPPTVGYELAKVEDPTAQAELAARVIDEGLSRAETVAAVRRAAGKPTKSKGRGAGKAKQVTARVFRSESGPRVTVEFKRGLDDALIVAALGEALDQAKARLGAGGQAA